jgi:hypothetical protein
MNSFLNTHYTQTFYIYAWKEVILTSEFFLLAYFVILASAFQHESESRTARIYGLVRYGPATLKGQLNWSPVGTVYGQVTQASNRHTGTVAAKYNYRIFCPLLMAAQINCVLYNYSQKLRHVFAKVFIRILHSFSREKFR